MWPKDAMFAIYKKELRAYFINPIGYVYTGVFLAIAALICSFTTWQKANYDTTSYFQYLIFTFVIMIPLLTMRLFSEERKSRTEQLLLTAPVSITGMVLGKYLAALTLFVSTILVSCINFFPLLSMAIVERSNATSDVHIGPVGGEVVGCLVGVILIGAARSGGWCWVGFRCCPGSTVFLWVCLIFRRSFITCQLRVFSCF